MFTKESLDTLRRRIDLVDVLSAHVEFKRSGAAFKALCPFHDEKTPSFIIQKGDTHYHCFGCGAHGDAIQFLMNFLKMTFLEAVETLAQKFQVPLEQAEEGDKKETNKKALKEALLEACRFYQFMLLHSPEGHHALQYLNNRQIDLEFITKFQIGYAPAIPGMLRQALHTKFIKDDFMLEAGLLTSSSENGKLRDFFSDRITVPIFDASGAVIGFSARKFKEQTFGGKYINTPETPLFKKSRILFGLNYCRRRIAKEQRAIVVEGQLDALKLIDAGLNLTVAGQGTAFGEGHVRELVALGVTKVFLALDPDEAGQNATHKIGHLFQKEGVEVFIVKMPSGYDPDLFLRQNGVEQFVKLLEKSEDYVTFLVTYHSKSLNIESPAGKNQLVQMLATQIRSWPHSVLVHESLRKLAFLTKIPEEMIGVGQDHLPNIFIKKSANVGIQTIDPDIIVEADFLRWLLLMGRSMPAFFELAKSNVDPMYLQNALCRRIYQILLNNHANNLPNDLISISIDIDDAEGQRLLSSILEKKVNKDKASELFIESMQRLLDRNWMTERESIRKKIQSGQCSEEEVAVLIKQFDELKTKKPQLKCEGQRT